MINHHKSKSTSLLNDAGRRKFLKTTLIGGITLTGFPLTSNALFARHGKNNYDLTLDVPTRYYDGDNCFVHPRAGIVAGSGKDGLPRVVMTMNLWDLSGSDVFRA